MTRLNLASPKPSITFDPAYKAATITLPEAANLGVKSNPWLTGPRLFLLVLLGAFVLRIFYAGHLYEDDGLWFTAAEQILRGKALYHEIYFDKPPLLPLTYALLFKCFGAHILTIRLFTIVYSAAISMMLYWFGSELYDKRAGVLSALLFTFFSTAYDVGHVQALNTDFLMVAPYTIAAFLFFRANSAGFHNAFTRRRASVYTLAGGVLTGVACQTNPKGIMDLLFLALLLTASVIYRGPSAALTSEWCSEPLGSVKARVRWPLALLGTLLGTAALGFIIGSAPFLLYVWHSRALTDYWDYVWRWGYRYSNYYSLTRGITHGVWESAGYFALNSTLAIALCVVVAGVIRGFAGTTRTKVRAGHPWLVVSMTAEQRESERLFRSDFDLLLWFIASFVGVSLGGRFFPHYFFQIMPGLCLLGSRGLLRIKGWLVHTNSDRVLRKWGRLAAVALAAGFVVTIVRYHSRTFWLATDWLRGTKSEQTRTWYHEVRNHDERTAAAFVRDLPDPRTAPDKFGLEAIRSNQQGARPAGSSDYLFVWGYRPWIYYWSGLIPASKFLSAQPLTGIPAGSEYKKGEARSLLGPDETAAARAELIEELRRTRPLYIVDEWGMYNAALSVISYPDMQEFMRDYQSINRAGNLMIYRRKN